MDNGARIIVQASGLDMQYFLGNCRASAGTILYGARGCPAGRYIFLRVSRRVLKECCYVDDDGNGGDGDGDDDDDVSVGRNDRRSCENRLFDWSTAPTDVTLYSPR